MGTIQQRFEIDQPAAAAYEALSAPRELLQKLPRVRTVVAVSDDHYHFAIESAGGMREVDLHMARHPELRRIEWRTGDGTWTGALTVEQIGPTRSAVGVHAESAAAHPDASPSAVQDALQALKRALESREVRISQNPNYSSEGAAARAGHGHASDWRSSAGDWRRAARSALAHPTEYPFEIMRTFTRQVDQLWEQVWRGTPIARLPHMLPGLGWNPGVEVCQQDDHVRVCVDVPGVDESHLQVEIDDSSLTVRGERHDDRRAEPGQRHSELHYGSFTRRIPLPDGIEADAARAVLRNGVLEIRIPRRRREPRRVPVQHAS